VTWLHLFFALELGFLPLGEYQVYDAGVQRAVFSGTFYSEFTVRAEAYGFYADGIVRTTVWKMSNNLLFWPERALYEVGVGYRVGPVTVGFRHWCMHPFMLPREYYQRPVYLQGAFDELFVRIER